jgi:hypothetical protein
MAGLLNLAIRGQSQSMFDLNELIVRGFSCLSLTEASMSIGRNNEDVNGKVAHILVDSPVNQLSCDT